MTLSNSSEGEWILVTGAAGAFGFVICERLRRDGLRVAGIDLREPRKHSLDGFFKVDVASEPDVAGAAVELREARIRLAGLVFEQASKFNPFRRPILTPDFS